VRFGRLPIFQGLQWEGRTYSARYRSTVLVLDGKLKETTKHLRNYVN